MDLLYKEFFIYLIDHISLYDFFKLRSCSRWLKNNIDNSLVLRKCSIRCLGTERFNSREQLFSDLAFWVPYFYKYNLTRDDFKHGISEEYTFDSELIRESICWKGIAISHNRNDYCIYQLGDIESKGDRYDPLNFSSVVENSKNIKVIFNRHNFLKYIFTKNHKSKPRFSEKDIPADLSCALNRLAWSIEWEDFKKIENELEELSYRT
jgi:hypothetical protein